MHAILLAGGLGTRLKSVINDRPKPMALIKDKPFLEYVLMELRRNNVIDVIFAVGYKGSMVEEYFGDGEGFGMNILYSYEENPLGTAGAIKLAGKYIQGDKFLVLNADTLYRLDYTRILAVQEELNLDMTLVLRTVSDISRYGAAKLSEEKVGMLTAFNEKESEHKSGTINGGVYLMSTKLLEEIPEGKVSLENEVIPKLMKEKVEKFKLGGLVNDGYFIDIGIPKDYYRFISDVESEVIKW